jgi:hypothetical protein
LTRCAASVFASIPQAHSTPGTQPRPRAVSDLLCAGDSSGGALSRPSKSMASPSPAADDLDPAAFVKRIRELGAKHDHEDALRLSAIESDIEKSRSERAARRAGMLVLVSATLICR